MIKVCPFRVMATVNSQIYVDADKINISTHIREKVICLEEQCAWWTGDDCAILQIAHALTVQ